ncbi:unnamed protein product [Rhizophagus irregularis]|nr:unnamed protein product [Rhizophagus irregularis]
MELACKKAKSLADKAASLYDKPNTSDISFFKQNKNKKANPELVIDAQHTLEREEAKFYDDVMVQSWLRRKPDRSY